MREVRRKSNTKLFHLLRDYYIPKQNELKANKALGLNSKIPMIWMDDLKYRKLLHRTAEGIISVMLFKHMFVDAIHDPPFTYRSLPYGGPNDPLLNSIESQVWSEYIHLIMNNEDQSLCKEYINDRIILNNKLFEEGDLGWTKDYINPIFTRHLKGDIEYGTDDNKERCSSIKSVRDSSQT